MRAASAGAAKRTGPKCRPSHMARSRERWAARAGERRTGSESGNP